METKQQTESPVSDRPSFFGMPRGMRFWLQAGPRFWTGAVFGLLNGLGFGLITGAALVLQWKVITLENDGLLTMISLILLSIASFFVCWSIGRIERREQQNP